MRSLTASPMNFDVGLSNQTMRNVVFKLPPTNNAIAIGILVLASGCASMTDCYYEHTQKSRAVVQYLKCGKPECSPYPHDYKCGWLDGFYEVATGGCDCPPAIAPPRYWKPGQILKDCDNRRHAYYSGWQDGAARASQFPDTHYLRIYETCECPFPKCENPCFFCAPCADPIGLQHGDMLEQPYPIAAPDHFVAPGLIDGGHLESVPVTPAHQHETGVAEPAESVPAKTKKEDPKDSGDAESIPAPVATPALPDTSWLPRGSGVQPIVREARQAASSSLIVPRLEPSAVSPVVLAPISFEMIDSESIIKVAK